MTTTLRLDVPVDVQNQADLDRLNRQIDETGTKTDKTGSVMTGVFQGVGQAVTGFGIGLAKAGLDMAIDKIGDSIGLASDKAEAASKVNVLFGASADIVTAASEDAATSVGLSSGAYLTAAGDLGNLTTNLGFSGAEAANMSVDMLALAADMGSFNNADTTDVTEAMGAAFRGETEPIRRFGVMLDDASVKAKAVEMGLYDGIGAIDKNAKAQATYALILEQTTAAQGDFARTSDGLANTQKISAAKMDEAWTKVGESLTPIVADLLPIFADGVAWVAEQIAFVINAVKTWVDDNQELVTQIQRGFDALVSFASLIGGAVIATIGELAYRIGGLIGLVVDLAGALIDTGAAVVSVLSGDFAGAAEAGERALDRVGSFAENVQRAMGDTGRRAADEALAAAAVTTQAADEAASGVINNLAGGYAAGAPEVGAAAAEVAATIPDALEKVQPEVRQIAAQTPGEVAAGIRSARSAPIDAIDQLKTDLKNTLSPAKEIARLEGQLHNKFLAQGMHSQDPVVQHQAQQTLDTITTRLDELKGKATTAGQAGGAAVGTGLTSKDPAVQAAARSTTAVVTTQFDTLENGSRIAAQTANLTLASGLQAGTTGAQRAGENVAAAWGNALTRTVAGYRDEIGRAAAYATAPIHGQSPPKVGPLRNIDDWGSAIGGAWMDGLERALPQASVGGAAGAGGGGAVYNITVQAGVGDPVAIGAQTVAAIQAYERSGGRDWRAA